MRVALFATCVGDTLFPEAARATVEVLERLGHEVAGPEEQTCCGQLHLNSGYAPMRASSRAATRTCLPADGPEELHVVLLDNGRTRVLRDEVGRQALHCIRRSACLNVCPVYSRVGGHAYGSVSPGPIGPVLTAQLVGVENAPSLPYASSLCGACYEVCPVKIDIPRVLLHLRSQVAKPASERFVMASPRRVFGGPRRPAVAQRPFVRAGRIRRLPPPVSAWTRTSDLKAAPSQTFREWWRDR